MRREKDLLIIIGVLVFTVLAIGLVIWLKVDEARHCTKWGKEKVFETVCLSQTSTGACTHSEGRWVERDVCVERDDR